jgi:hypothetical protein
MGQGGLHLEAWDKRSEYSVRCIQDKAEEKPEVKEEVKPEVKEEVKPEVKEEVKPEAEGEQK